MKLSTMDVRDVITSVMVDHGYPVEEVPIYEKATQPIVGLMGKPINEDMSWKQIEQLIVSLCAPDDGYGVDPDVTNGGLMDFGFDYGSMINVIRAARDELLDLHKSK